ncbi:hypothetical protein NEISICOT_01679 [Neisseria sicca ATCC 29256]|uniref:Uncharacterized protein n=1 Tax=Neisseria sicca ATCC 29256 TaxID=547045 RepID=C6M580_NEISI|nr:hypothetical protein NEISICOT_01679 [Neisseria sicca ATCC 29256]
MRCWRKALCKSHCPDFRLWKGRLKTLIQGFQTTFFTVRNCL